MHPIIDYARPFQPMHINILSTVPILNPLVCLNPLVKRVNRLKENSQDVLIYRFNPIYHKHLSTG